MNTEAEPLPTNQEAPSLSGAELAQNLLAIQEQQKAAESLESSIAGLRESATPEDLSTAIIEAIAANPEAAKTHLAALCTTREVGSPYRDNDGAKYKLDTTLILLVRQGQIEAAKGLVSASPSEAKVIEFPLTNASLEPEEAERVRTTIARLSEEKHRELFTTITGNGLDAQSANILIETAGSPDSASTVPQKIWQELPAYPDAAKREASNFEGDIAVRMELISGVVDRGLGNYAGEFVPNATKLKDPADRKIYLDSARLAAEALATIEPDNPSSAARQNAIKSVAPFADPVVALRASEAIFGEPNAQTIRQFAALCDKYPTDLIEFSPGFAIALKDAAADPQATPYLDLIARRVRDEAEPTRTCDVIRQGLDIVGTDFDGSPDFADRVIRGNQPLEVAKALLVAKPLLADASPQLKNMFVDALATGPEPQATANAFIETARSLSAQDINSGSIDSKSFLSLKSLVEAHHDSEQLDAKVERFCTNWKINSEYAKAFERGLVPVAASGLASSADRALRPRFEDMPTLAAEFDQSGLTDEAAREMFDTWTEFSAFSMLRFNSGAKPEVSSGELMSVEKNQCEMIASQVEAFTDYADSYGANELNSVINTFGIRNFRRYRPGQLHNQLASWDDGSATYENVIIAAQSDWNGAVKDVGSDFTSQIGSSAVYFEAGDSTSLAKDLVAIGSRDRANGRDPLKEGTVKNLIIHGHANPDGLLLGSRNDVNEGIDVADFIDLDTKRAKIHGRANDYTRHLGPNFRVILQACSTAGTPKGGRNIAETLSQEHNLSVAGSPFATKGAFIIEPDGNVTFRSDQIDSKDQRVAGIVYDN